MTVCWKKNSHYEKGAAADAAAPLFFGREGAAVKIRLHCEERGKGLPLVLLHGNGEDSTYFSSQIEEFSRRYHVMAVDTRGHGKSPRGDGPFTLERFAEDLKDFLDERGIRETALLGFSDGGNIALLFALRYPSYVSRLVLNGANLYPSGLKKTVLLPIQLDWALTGALSPVSRRAALRHEFLGLMVREPKIRPDELKKIQVPALVIAGTDDMIKEKHTGMIASKLPGGQLALIEGDHFVAKNNSREFNRTVMEFLEG